MGLCLKQKKTPMNTLTATQPELIRPRENMTRYWRIDRVHGKGKRQTHRYLCTVS